VAEFVSQTVGPPASDDVSDGVAIGNVGGRELDRQRNTIGDEGDPYIAAVVDVLDHIHVLSVYPIAGDRPVHVSDRTTGGRVGGVGALPVMTGRLSLS
jgi:hypothetical protein